MRTSSRCVIFINNKVLLIYGKKIIKNIMYFLAKKQKKTKVKRNVL